MQLKVLDRETFVWLLTGTAHGTTLTAFYEVPRSKQWFAERVFKIRDAFNSGHPEQFDSGITDELCDALVPVSVRANIEAAKVLVVIPDDVLFLYPRDALSPRTIPVRRQAHQYFPSSAALRLARTSIHATEDWQETLLGIADPITSTDDPRYFVLMPALTSSHKGSRVNRRLTLRHSTALYRVGSRSNVCPRPQMKFKVLPNFSPRLRREQRSGWEWMQQKRNSSAQIWGGTDLYTLRRMASSQ